MKLILIKFHNQSNCKTRKILRFKTEKKLKR